MKLLNRTLLVSLIISLSITGFSQKNDPNPKTDESHKSEGLRKVTTRSFDQEINIEIDEEAIEATVNEAMKSVEDVLKNLELNLENLEINLSELEILAEPIVINIPDIDLEPLEFDFHDTDFDIDIDEHSDWDNDTDDDDQFIEKEKSKDKDKSDKIEDKDKSKGLKKIN